MDGSPESALRWIGSLNDNYIMVFNNADVLLPKELAEYFPPGLGGNILITSCNHTLEHLTSPMSSFEVKLMKVNDATELLLKVGGLDPSGIWLRTRAHFIVEKLSHIPLAVSLAGVSIASGAATIGNYYKKYSNHLRILIAHPEFRGASKCDRTVYGNCELLYEEIQQRVKSNDSHQSQAAKSAIFLLAILSFFHHEGIMEDIFSYVDMKKEEIEMEKQNLSLATSQPNYTLLPLSGADTWNGSIFEGVQLLASLQLIKLDSSDGTYKMHPLVHAWARNRMTANESKWYCSRAHAILASSVKSDENQPVRFRRALVTHVVASMEQSRVKKHTVIGNCENDACKKFLLLLREQGHLSVTEKLAVQVLDAKSRLLGEEHLDTIMAMANLAMTYDHLGKYTDAEELKTKVLHRRKKILGSKDTDTIMAMANLAVTYDHLGKYTDAEELETKVLDRRRKILGPKHPDTITAMANLAATYGSLGKYTDAQILETQALESSITILGPEHPDTIMAMANLAVTHDHLGEYTDAENLKVQVLNARKRILGVEHPHTIMAMADLAVSHGNMGKYEDAERLEVQVLDARKRILGVEHPHTILAMANLAVSHGNLGKYEDAEKLNVQLLDAMVNDRATKFLQGKHPHITEVMTNLAPSGKQLVLVAKTALQHLQQCEAEIKATLKDSKISEQDYILLAGFNESVIRSGTGYLEEIHVLLRGKHPPGEALIKSLGKIFSPFPGMLYTTSSPYCHQTPVFNREGMTLEWNEIVYTKAHTYTTLLKGNKVKEMEIMSACICCNEGNILSGSGSGGGSDGNEKKQGENITQDRRIGGNPQKGGKKDSEGDDNDFKGDDSDKPDLKGSLSADLLRISFNTQTEIYANAPPVTLGLSSSKPSKRFQLLQLEGSITVQVSFSS